VHPSPLALARGVKSLHQRPLDSDNTLLTTIFNDGGQVHSLLKTGSYGVFDLPSNWIA
jgi:hypothetical protein